MNTEKRFPLIRRHARFREEILESLKRQSEREIQTISTKEARKAYEWNRQVASCYHLSRSFSRLRTNKHGIVYCEIEPEHFVEDLVAKWFYTRFPKFAVIVSSKRGCFICEKGKLTRSDLKLKELIGIKEKSLPINPILAEMEDFQTEEFWESYYSSQLIEERRNKKYFLRNMPKKYHKWESLKSERKVWRKDKNLSEF